MAFSSSSSQWQVSRGDGNGGDGLTAVKGAVSADAPTVVWLHGLGDSGHGWVDAFTSDGIVLPVGTKVILPTATERPITVNGGAAMPGWYDIVALTRGAPVDAEGIAASVTRVKALIAKETGPVVLGGFSQGGAISLSAALSKEDKPFSNVVAVVSLSAYLPNSHLYDAAPVDGPKRFLLCHGDQDQVIDFEAGKAAHTALQSLGLQSTFQLFRGMAHSARPDEFQTVSAFLTDVLSSSSSSDSSSL